MRIKEYLINRKSKLEKEVEALEKFMAHVPEGTLVERYQRGGYVFTKRILNKENLKEEKLDNKLIKTSEGEIIKKQKKYLEKYLSKESEEAMLLAKSEYSRRRLKDAKEELKLVEEYLRFENKEKNAEKYLSTHKGAYTLLAPKLKTEDEKLKKWIEADYPRSTNWPENLIVPTVIEGLDVRSKSEADIISRLVHFGVPFRYEDAVMTKRGIYHPDIHLKSIADGNDWYWEHLGAMDSYKYRNDNYSRLKDLNDIGIIQWKNLIITTETEDRPLDIRWVDEIIKYYLL